MSGVVMAFKKIALLSFSLLVLTSCKNGYEPLISTSAGQVFDKTARCKSPRCIAPTPTPMPTTTPAPTATPTPGPTATPTATPTPTAQVYDDSMGAGVDENGFANLPLHSSAKRIFVNSSTGADSNNGLTPATAVATGAHALTISTDGEGDQILFAERTTYTERIPSMAFRTGGYSYLYPFAFQSYDPADPLNEAKYGRATGSNRPVFAADTNPGNPWMFGNTHQNYIAVRGLDINPGNVSGQGIGMVDVESGILFENNILRYTGIGLGNTSGVKQHHWIFRNNSIYGEWEATVATGGQGLYADGSDSLTIEDNVFYHNGWKIGANRSDSLANGGATEFRHPIYQQVPTDAVVRRNLMIDGSADGGSFRGQISHYENVIIDCPIAAGLGGGVAYDTGRPNGVMISSHDNAVIGSAQVPDSGAAGWGIGSANGKPGSSIYKNLIARSPYGSIAFSNSASFAQPSYVDYNSNVVYQWSITGGTYFTQTGTYADQVHTTYNNNIWDDSTSGTNINNSGVSFPKPYTAAELYIALGFADKQAFVNYVIQHPEAHLQRKARELLFAGYGMN
jgi:hypothetical protein